MLLCVRACTSALSAVTCDFPVADRVVQNAHLLPSFSSGSTNPVVAEYSKCIRHASRKVIET